MFTSFQHYLEKLKPCLDDKFKEQLSAILGDSENSGIATFRTVLMGGKRIRGCLLFMVSDILGGPLESALSRAVAVELIHTASLIHDDFVDQDVTRRNMPALWTLEGARRAVLLGDLIFASAIEMMSLLSGEDGLIVSHAIAQISRGAFDERLDPLMLAKEIESNHFDDSIYEKIISLKTGILFGAACQLGAVTAGADEKAKADLYQYGLQIGEAYQIADDLQEIKHHLVTHAIDPGQMSALTPALCYFVKGSWPLIMPILAGRSSELNGESKDLFMAAERLMTDEIEQRLNSAVSKITTAIPRDGRHLLTKAAWELIEMFHQT